MSGTTAQCPVCGTPITETRYAQIQEQIRNEEQANVAALTEKLRCEHEAALRDATRLAEQRGRQEAEQKLTEALANEAKQAERIANLETKATAQRAEHEVALKEATRLAQQRGKQEAEQKLAQALANGAKQAERIADLETKATAQLAEHDVALKEATRLAEQRGKREAEQKLAQALANEAKQAERIADLETKATAQRAAHDAALKEATRLAEERGKKEADQKLAQALANETKQAERIAELEAAAATQRASASRAQEQLKAQHATDLKAASEKAAKDASAAAVAQLNAKEAEVRTLREAHAAELKQQREALDEHRDLELQKLRREQALTTEGLQKKVQELNRKLEQKTAHELGEFPEIDLHRALCEAFPGDNIRRVKKGESGADIVHEVMHNGQYCQTIVYDSKNRRLWQNLFVQKLLADAASAKAEHAILVSAVFPTGQRDLCAVDGVIIAKLSQVVTIARLIRENIVNDYLRNLSFKDRTEKKEKLYSLITSEMFRQRMAAVERAVRDLEEIDAREVEEHRKVWNKRNLQYKTVDKSVRDLVTDVNVILQSPESSSDEAPAPAATGTGDRIPF